MTLRLVRGRSRHARAVSLLGGWLLMTAPLVKDQTTATGYRLRLDAPINEWVQDSAHDTAKSCEAMKHEEFQEAMKHSKEAFAERQKKDPNYKEEGSDSNVDTYLYSRCVPAEYIYPQKESVKK